MDCRLNSQRCPIIFFKYTLEKTEGENKKGQSRQTGNIGHTRRRQTQPKPQHNKRWTPLYVNKHK